MQRYPWYADNVRELFNGGLAQLARASALQAESDQFDSDILHIASVAQLVEQLICNQQVVGSSPSIGSLKN